MLSPDFLTAGRALFTIEVPEAFRAERPSVRPHYTYKITRKEASERFPEAYFVALLSGPDNESDYSYLGMLTPETGDVRLTAKSRYSPDSWPVCILKRVLARIWDGQSAMITQQGWELHHEGKCGRCGRTLTVPSSVESGIGPECAKML